MQTNENLLSYLVGITMATLVGKIIWDWLSNSRHVSREEYNKFRDEICVRLARLEEKIDKILFASLERNRRE